MKRPSVSPNISETLRKNFTVALSSYAGVYADTQQYSDKKTLYSFDFSLLHPYIFRSTHGKDPQYDAMGRSIFSMLPLYVNACGFVPVFSTPSVLELLDALEHRYERISRMLKANHTVERMRSQLKMAITEDGELFDKDLTEITRFLSSLRLNDKQHDSLSAFLTMFSTKKISMIRDHIDPSEIKSLHSKHASDFKVIYDRMLIERGKDDTRRGNDKEFHYKVDTWNLSMSMLSQYLSGVEVDHVCRGGISRYIPSQFKREFTRHPLIPMIRLLSLLRASEDSNIQSESNAFVKFGIRDISEMYNIIKADDVEDLTFEERNEIDRVYDKYIRPMYYDYSQPDGAVDLRKAMEEIREMEDSKYKSITTVEGLREMFKANANDIKMAAHSVVSANPDLLSSRILEDYELESSPRIEEIKRQFDL